MSVGQSLLPEFDMEMASTRKTLERVPDEKFTWKPHPKSSDMGWLANHIANLANWATLTLAKDSLDIAPKDGPALSITPVTNAKGLLEVFDKNVAAARAAIANATNEQLMSNWSLLKGGETVMTMPKIAVLRSFVMSHMIHHRAQLTVYLRLNDVPVPAIYGPSADEGVF
jgi:uncharacterized damage-inducible protein DinB